MPKRGVRVVRREFFALLREAKRNDWDHKRNCYGRGEDFANYEVAPEPAVAEEMCASCPIRQLCREYGEVSKPGWGVWGGIGYDDGKPILEEIPLDLGELRVLQMADKEIGRLAS